MKKRILTFVLALFLILPCAILFVACGDDPVEPTLNGYKLYINGEDTQSFECEWGQNAITANNVVIKSDWSDSSKNGAVPLSEFDISVSWTDADYVEHDTFPNFWTEGTTINDVPTAYSFTFKKDGKEVYMWVYISKANSLNPSVKIKHSGDGSEKSVRSVEWNYNNRNCDNPSKQYSLTVAGGIEEGYNLDNAIWYAVEKDIYNAIETEEEKKRYVSENVSSCSSGQIFEFEPGEYYVFAYLSESEHYTYGENGWIYNYATLKIVPADIEQEIKTNVYDFSEDSGSNFSYNELADYCEQEVELAQYSGALSYYGFSGGEWGNLNNIPTCNAVKVNAVVENGEYVLVDYDPYNEVWCKLNADGDFGEKLDDDADIEFVDYVEIQSYIEGNTITFPVYYKINEEVGGFYNFDEIFKTYITLNKYKLTGKVPCSVIEVEGGSSLINSFNFEYSGENFKFYIEKAFGFYDNSTYRNLYEIVGGEEVDAGSYSAKLVIKNPNYAWKYNSDDEYDSIVYTSEPISISYVIEPAKVNRPYYQLEQDKFYEYLGSAIEVTYSADMGWSEYSYDSYLTNSVYYSGQVNAYKYKLTADDYSLGIEELIAKVKQNGSLNSESRKITDDVNHTAGKYVVLFDLSSAQNYIWDDGSLTAKIFAFDIVKAEQNPFISAGAYQISAPRDTIIIDIDLTGSVNLYDIFVEEKEVEFYYGADTEFEFEIVDAITGINAVPVGSAIIDEYGNLKFNDLNSATDSVGTVFIKIHKDGDDCYLDYDVYVQVEINKYDLKDETSEFMASLESLDCYEDGVITCTSGQTLGEIFAEAGITLPTSEAGTYKLYTHASSYSEFALDTEINFSYDLYLCLVPNEDKKWLISNYDSSAGLVDNRISIQVVVA